MPESEHGDADRHEMLDMDNYEYVPAHAKRSFDKEFLHSISSWRTCTKDKILEAVDKLGEMCVLEQGSAKTYGLQEALKKHLIPELSQEAAGIFTRSEQILQDYARKRTMNATEFQKELHIPKKKDKVKWSTSELNDILLHNLASDMMKTFGCIQWEHDKLIGKPKARCYLFAMDGHKFRGKNPKVHIL